MSACCRYWLNATRNRKQKNPLPWNDTVIKGTNANSVDTINEPTDATNAVENNSNQANAPPPVTSQPGNRDPVRMMVIALPGPGHTVFKSRSCPPLDVTNEIEALDTVSTVTDNSDFAWMDARNPVTKALGAERLSSIFPLFINSFLPTHHLADWLYFSICIFIAIYM
ncbi:expressed conserved protein [Echinococcus multilocularis]|uniref:Expressed conserved protein n=1 Tax=Echinococcus multilocularis TaxID=6211 RepID=A0A068Y040_ECHMU|nr:expressed conserved protein [Echinococcus multilocularis]